MDACTLIYLIKSKLLTKFMDLAEYPVVIDSSVYQEVVIDGKAKKYPDAIEAEFISILKKLESVSATKSKSILFFIEKLHQRK